MSYSRDDILFRAEMAKETERYHELVEEMKILAKMDQEFNAEERSLLAIAYRRVLYPRRYSWLTLSIIIEEKKLEGATPEELQILISYRQKVEEEIKSICNDATELIDNHLLPKALTTDGKTYYLKLKGDCYGHLAEFMSGDCLADAVSRSAAAYEKAAALSVEVDPLHLTRLEVSGSSADFSLR